MSSGDIYIRDDWPLGPDGQEYDGLGLMQLFREGNSPFRNSWDIGLLLREVRDSLRQDVIDISLASKGSNAIGLMAQVHNGQPIVIRLSRTDVNMPGWDGYPLEKQHSDMNIVIAVHDMLRDQQDIPMSRLLYSRPPQQAPSSLLELPSDLSGRRMEIFAPLKGSKNIWKTLLQDHKLHLLSQAAHIRASLFDYCLPDTFSALWLRQRLFSHRPAGFAIPVAPTRDFSLELFKAKIHVTIGEIGEMIGWEGDNVFVGPVAAAAKQSLLRFMPHMLPDLPDNNSLYRLVLEHDDFGIHNMTIDTESGEPKITSLFDWDTAYIVPAILANPEMAVIVDLMADESGRPYFDRIDGGESMEELAVYQSWATHYINHLFSCSPAFQRAVVVGKDARFLWFRLKDWRGTKPEEYFGELGAWAERRMQELGV